MPDKNISLRQWLSREPFTLTMSSGFFGFYAHCGMLAALEDQGLAPASVTGSSAGALVGACWASGRSATELGAELRQLRKEDFWDPGFGLGLLRGAGFRKTVRSVIDAARIEDCRVPVRVSVFDALSGTTHVLKSGPIDRAVYASCAVPLMFHPIVIDGRIYLDGGIRDRPGLAGAPRDARVLYHHIDARTPWGRGYIPASGMRDRPNLVSLSIANLPRPGPERMDLGSDAFATAREKTLTALDRPLRQIGTSFGVRIY